MSGMMKPGETGTGCGYFLVILVVAALALLPLFLALR